MAKLTEEQRRSRAAARRRTEALKAEADAHRREERSAQWAREGTRLSYEEVSSGVACRGCGEPLRDGTGGWTRGTMHMDAQEQAEYAEAERAYQERHGECRSHRHGLEGSRMWHCGFCCPPPPLSPGQIEAVAGILRASSPRPDELDDWSLELTCGHLVRARQHRSNGEFNVCGTRSCPECGGTQRGIIAAARIGTLAETATPSSGEVRPVKIQELDGALKVAKRALERHEKAARQARSQVEELESQLSLLSDGGPE